MRRYGYSWLQTGTQSILQIFSYLRSFEKIDIEVTHNAHFIGFIEFGHSFRNFMIIDYGISVHHHLVGDIQC